MGNDATKVFKTSADGTITVTLTKAKTDTSSTSIAEIVNLMDSMISKVDGARADLGALQNHNSACIAA